LYNYLDKTCYSCKKGHTLSISKTKCFVNSKSSNLMNTINSNYISSNQNFSNNFNYYFNTDIGQSDNFCEDSISFTGSESCRLCDIGYYLNSENKCEKDLSQDSICMFESPQTYFYFEMGGSSNKDSWTFNLPSSRLLSIFTNFTSTHAIFPENRSASNP
jgi:hypothetical protein